MINILWDDSTDFKMVRGVLEEVFDSTDRPGWQQWKNVFKAETTDQYKVFDSRMAGLPHGGEVGFGANIPTYDPVKGDEIDFTQKRYGSGFTITSATKKFFKQFNFTEKMVRNLKQTMLEMKDIEVAKLYNNPTSTTYGAGYDGLAMLHNSHTCMDDSSTTYDNYVTADLSVGSYEDAKIYFRKVVDDQGQTDPKKMDTLVVPPELETTAQQIMQSQLVPFEESNTKNVLANLGVSLFVYDRMTDTDGWFALKKNDEDFGPVVKTSQEPDVKIQDAADTSRNTWVTSEQYFTYGIRDARLVYGSVPA